MSLDLVIKFETEGIDDLDEALALADFVFATGLHRSTGSWGRFLATMAEHHGWTPPVLPNRLRANGADRCACGCKYWSDDRCIDCGGIEVESD